MRQRVEDLGRIFVMIDHVLEHELFSEHRVRPKDYSEWFQSQDEDKRDDILRGFAYGLQDISSSLYNIREIAMGEDNLNQQPMELV